MALVNTTGVTSIGFGDLANDGGPATTFTPLGLTAEGSAELSQADNEDTEFFAEEFDTAIEVSTKAGKRTFKLSLTSMDVTALKTVFGGTLVAKSGATPASLSLPAGVVTFEKSIKITPKKGLTFILNRVQVSAKLNYKVGRKDLFLVDLTCNVLQPTKNGVDAVSIIDPV